MQMLCVFTSFYPYFWRLNVKTLVWLYTWLYVWLYTEKTK
nr:MAG TPA: hypothetical protein [Caudoviricetes sp.]